MGKIIALAAYIAYLSFCFKVFSHGLRWYKAARHQDVSHVGKARISLKILLMTVIDVIIFRRLFNTNKLLWGASWMFHISFVFVLIRHSRYFLVPVPNVVVSMQPFGVVAGHVLPFALLVIILIRFSEARKGYIARSNIFISGMMFLISITGLTMRYVFHPDVMWVKAFVMGILVFNPDFLPPDPVFILHFILFLILLPFIPIHLFTVPVVSLSALKREEGLRQVLHEG